MYTAGGNTFSWPAVGATSGDGTVEATRRQRFDLAVNKHGGDVWPQCRLLPLEGILVSLLMIPSPCSSEPSPALGVPVEAVVEEGRGNLISDRTAVVGGAVVLQPKKARKKRGGAFSTPGRRPIGGRQQLNSSQLKDLHYNDDASRQHRVVSLAVCLCNLLSLPREVQKAFSSGGVRFVSNHHAQLTQGRTKAVGHATFKHVDPLLKHFYDDYSTHLPLNGNTTASAPAPVTKTDDESDDDDDDAAMMQRIELFSQTSDPEDVAAAADGLSSCCNFGHGHHCHILDAEPQDLGYLMPILNATSYVQSRILLTNWSYGLCYSPFREHPGEMKFWSILNHAGFIAALCGNISYFENQRKIPISTVTSSLSTKCESVLAEWRREECLAASIYGAILGEHLELLKYLWKTMFLAVENPNQEIERADSVFRMPFLHWRGVFPDAPDTFLGHTPLTLTLSRGWFQGFKFLWEQCYVAAGDVNTNIVRKPTHPLLIPILNENISDQASSKYVDLFIESGVDVASIALEESEELFEVAEKLDLVECAYLKICLAGSTVVDPLSFALWQRKPITAALLLNRGGCSPHRALQKDCLTPLQAIDFYITPCCVSEPLRERLYRFCRVAETERTEG